MATLDGSGKGLTHIPVEELQGRPYKVVNLSNNKILKLDPPIAHDECGEIEELSLMSNRLVRIEGISRLSNLRILKLARNSISKLENLDHLVHLRYCDLSHNNIKAIDNLHNNLNLEFLDLSYNGIRNLRPSSTPIISLPSLRTLLLGHNMLKSIEDAPSHLPPSLTNLGLDYNDIQGVHNLAVLAAFAKLSEISLRGNPLIPSLASHVDSVPLVARLLPNVASVDGKEITVKQREIALALFGDDVSPAYFSVLPPSLTAPSSPNTRLGRLLDPAHEHDLAIYLSKRGKTSSSSPKLSSNSPTLRSSGIPPLDISNPSKNPATVSSTSSSLPPTASTLPSTSSPLASGSSSLSSSSSTNLTSMTNPTNNTKPTNSSTSTKASPSNPIDSPNLTNTGHSTSISNSTITTNNITSTKSTKSLKTANPPTTTSDSTSNPNPTSSSTNTSNPTISNSSSSKPSTSSNVSTDPNNDNHPQNSPSSTSRQRTKTSKNSKTDAATASPARPRTPPPQVAFDTPPASPAQGYPYPFSPFPAPKSPLSATFPISESPATYLIDSPASSPFKPTSIRPPYPTHSSTPSLSLSPPSSPHRARPPLSDATSLQKSLEHPPLSPRSAASHLASDAQVFALLSRMGTLEARCVVQEFALRELWAEVQFLRTVHLRREHKAATLIQRYWRGYFTRKLYGVIQRDFRKHLQTISVFVRVIQRHWRGFAARRRVAALRVAVRSAACVQSAVRGWLARRAYARTLRNSKAERTRIAQVEAECASLRTQMSNLNKYVLALAALVKQSASPAPPAAHRPASPAAHHNATPSTTHRSASPSTRHHASPAAHHTTPTATHLLASPAAYLPSPPPSPF